MNTGQRKKRRWPLVAAAVGVLAVGLIAGAALTAANSSHSNAASSPPTASATPTPMPLSPNVASGCAIGSPPSPAAFTQLRAQKDFTPTGAVAFLGAFLQLTAVANPGPIDGAYPATLAASSGPVRDLVTQAIGPGNNPYGDSSTHAMTLAGGKYVIVSATSSKVVVAMFGLMIKDGQLAQSDGRVVRSSGTYTLTPAADGWRVTNIGAGTSADTIETSGHVFEAAC